MHHISGSPQFPVAGKWILILFPHFMRSHCTICKTLMVVCSTANSDATSLQHLFPSHHPLHFWGQDWSRLEIETDQGKSSLFSNFQTSSLQIANTSIFTACTLWIEAKISKALKRAFSGISMKNKIKLCLSCRTHCDGNGDSLCPNYCAMRAAVILLFWTEFAMFEVVVSLWTLSFDSHFWIYKVMYVCIQILWRSVRSSLHSGPKTSKFKIPRVVKLVQNTQQYQYLWLTMWFHTKK